MRPVLHGDAVAAARRLLLLPEAARRPELDRMLARAEAADRYRKRFGRAHPQWGNGTLMGLAQHGGLPREPGLGRGAYCRCLALVYAALAEREADKLRLSARR